jgi:aminoglycoside 2'-N-acetyltransferase I
MTPVRTVHTADLDVRTLAAARRLLVDVFTADFDDHDWEHALGGLHALVWDGHDLVGHASLVQRRLMYDGRALRTGYVEGVAVHASRRGRGHGAAMMAALEQAIHRAYELGALAATGAATGFYAIRGWRRWQGPTRALTPAGTTRTRDADGAIYVLPAGAPLDLSAPLTCDWRDGDVW